MLLNPDLRKAFFTTALAVTAAIFATVISVVLFQGNFKVVVGIGAALLLLGGIILCGNIRLFCLWGLILTAPLALDKSFNVIAHMGGAGAITIDAMDAFLLPLTLFLIRDRMVGYRKDIRVPKVLYWWLGLTFLGMITIAIGPMRQVALLEVFRMLKLSLLFIVVVNEVVRIRQLGHLIAALMISVALQCVVGLLQFTFDINFGAQILGEVTKANAQYTSDATYLRIGGFNRGVGFTNRIGGLIGHPNLFAVFLAILLPIGLSILFSGIRPIYKIITMVITVMGLACLVFTLSRSAWISFGAALIALMIATFVLPGTRSKYVFERIAAIVLIVVVTVALSGPIMKRIFDSDEGAVSFRWKWMRVATEMALDKPLLGFGLNSFVWFMPPYTAQKTYNAVIDKYGHQEVLPVVHNIYLLVWSEQGTIGLILYMGFYIHLMRIAWRGMATYRQPFLAMVNLGCLAGLFALAIDGLASFFIRNPNCGRVFFIVAAIVVVIQWWHIENVDKRLANRK